MEWTDSEIETLTLLWTEGHSISEIGSRMGVSKNAIVGKAHRLDLPARPSPIKYRDGVRTVGKRRPKPIKLPALTAKVTCPPPQPTEPLPAPELDDRAVERQPAPEPAGPISHYMRAPKTCAWVNGNGRHTWTYCDAPTDVGPYCPEHAAICFKRPIAPTHRVAA